VTIRSRSVIFIPFSVSSSNWVCDKFVGGKS
jgi:hypothetical protein